MIAITGVKPINDDEQWIFVTLTVDGDECKFTHVAPTDLTGQVLQDYVNARENGYNLDILRDMYPGAIVIPAENQTMLEAFTAWIAAGHKNIVEIDDEQVETVITKTPWSGAHPEDLYQISVLDFRKRFTLAEKIAIHTSTDPIVQVFIGDLSAASFVDFRDPDLSAGMDYIVSLGLVTEARKSEILV